MKNFLIVLSVLFCNCANAQLKNLELTQGKYLENPIKNDFSGNWKSAGSDFKLSIANEKKQIKRGTIDIYVDFLNVKVTHFIKGGSQIANRFTLDMSLISVGNNNEFSGTYRDEVSGNNVKINLKRISSNELLFTSSLPEIDFTNHTEKGSVFPKLVTLFKD
ncbi:hypothetical protein ABIB62_000715 [Mucilaginibacter sp. UYP25]|uniref:hypothetical protein n=1 Tax=unclassified Mucilaginibacter TaxID=2617802 RepID=UPI003392BF0A